MPKVCLDIKNTLKNMMAYMAIIAVVVIYLWYYTLWKAMTDNVHYCTPNPNVDLISSNFLTILLWTSPLIEPFNTFGVGQSAFVLHNCSVIKCFVTPDICLYGGDAGKFNVVLFHGPELSLRVWKLPSTRVRQQKYIFVSSESSHYYNISKRLYDNFFNWTWTYKLNSDIPFYYIVIRDEKGEVIGPKQKMRWIKPKEMKPTPKSIEKYLNKKSKAAAWFVSNCYTLSKREDVVQQLRAELNKYHLDIDIYGECGNFSCPKKNDMCFQNIKNDYYFYLAFENSFDEDYVTEKLLTALHNYAVPIVFGEADYTRFMPPGIYLDAMKLNVSELARTMDILINDPKMYKDMFKWHNHYSYYINNKSSQTRPLCRFCEILNDSDRFQKESSYEKVDQFWASTD